MGKLNKLTFVLFGVVGILLVAVIVVGIIKIGGKNKDPEPSKKPEQTQESQTKESQTKKPEKTEPESTEEVTTEAPKKGGREELYFEDFEDGTHSMLARGTAEQLTLFEEGGYDGSATCLIVTNRTDQWNGASWTSGDAIKGGDKIYASAFVKYDVEGNVFNGETLDFDVFELSVQFNLNGQPNYDQIKILKIPNATWMELKGSYEVPENATDVRVYVEAERLEDIYVDNFSVYLEN